MNIPPLVLLAATFMLGGCTSYRDTTAGAFNSIGVMTIRDFWKEEAWRESLPKELALPASQIKTEPKAGYTKVTIVGVQDERKKIEIGKSLTKINTQNPDKPIKWSFK